MAGSLDKMAEKEALRDRLPDARLVTIEGAGHACHLEQPWVFDREVMRFLRAHGHDHLPELT